MSNLRRPSATSSIETSVRILAIDGLRAVAVGLVFMTHAYPTYFPGGFIGVDIFFVISGFVITRTLTANKINLRQFYMHRFFRIVPPIVPVLIFVGLMIYGGHTLTQPFDVFAAAASFMNWARAFGVTSGGVLGHFWSLSIEEQFYFIWPALLAALISRGRSIAKYVIILMVGMVFWQLVLFVATDDVNRVYNGLDTRGSQLLAGCLLAVIPLRSLSRWWPIPIFIFAPLVFFMHYDGLFYETVGIPLVTATAAMLLMIIIEGKSPINRLFTMPFFLWAGSRSYALYLWHYPLLDSMIGASKALQMSAFMGAGAAALLTFLAAELSHRIVELPARRLRQKLDAKAATISNVPLPQD